VDAIPFLGGRRKVIMEYSDDARVRGHRKPKDNPKIFWGGGTRGSRLSRGECQSPNGKLWRSVSSDPGHRNPNIFFCGGGHMELAAEQRDHLRGDSEVVGRPK
jgi:hypothetical protein